ncbi:MAG: hypothetical protein IIA60_08350 [Candidatus Marinimicrobia bacterium]|nr:hypothetical protein [Candidatus Neomarinimicrobiota bacterium]
MVYQRSSVESAPQTYVTKVFKPGDEGLVAAIEAQSTVKILVFQGPVKSGPTREYLILESGKYRIVNPEEGNPYQSIPWALYINLVGGWTQLKGQKRIPWKNNAPHRLLMRMVDEYPRPVDRFDAGDVQGKRMVSKGRFGGLMTEIREFVGKYVLPVRYRSLSPDAIIVVERRG